MTKNKWLSVNIVALACLTGFLKENPVNELESYLADVKISVRPNPNLDLGELPQEQVYVPAKYTGNSNPFDLKGFVKPKEIEGIAVTSMSKQEDCAIPNAPPVTGYLENYELMSLQMVGVIGKSHGSKERGKDPDGQFKALIKTPDSGVILAQYGEKLGTNHGKINEVNFGDLKATELHKISNCYQEKPATMQVH
ncbi:MAG: pilus assembly protein PilP [Cardiobacteriaceae bacterium]|nr:pilus assembly protein PilP [Cardiobacteriaceae bacterium]